MRTLLLVVCMGLLSFSVFASDQEQDQIDRLFEAMDADSMVDEMYNQMDVMFETMQQQMNISTDEMPIYNKHNKKMAEVLRQELSWAKMAPDMKNLYVQNFTTAEIQALLDFYESPAGQAFVKKMPVVMQESMVIGQQMLMQAMPQIQKLGLELSEELKAYRAESTK